MGLGSVLSDLLVEKKYKVVILDTKIKRPLLKNQKFIKGSILNDRKLQKAIKGSDYVFNFAALADLDLAKNLPLETANINIIGTIKALIMSKKNKIKKFIMRVLYTQIVNKVDFMVQVKKQQRILLKNFGKNTKLNFLF